MGVCGLIDIHHRFGWPQYRTQSRRLDEADFDATLG